MSGGFGIWAPACRLWPNLSWLGTSDWWIEVSIKAVAMPAAQEPALSGKRLSIVLALAALVIAAGIPVKEAAFGLAVAFLVMLRPLMPWQAGLVLMRVWPVLAMLGIALLMTVIDVTGEMDRRAVVRIAFYYVRIPVFLLLGFGARRCIIDDRPILWGVVVLGIVGAGQTLLTYASAGNLSGLDHNQVREVVGGGDTTSIFIPLCTVVLWPQIRSGALRLFLLAASGMAVLGVLAASSRAGLLVLAISAFLSLPHIRPLLVARWGSLVALGLTIFLTTPVLLPILHVFDIDPLHINSLAEVIARPRTDLQSINDQWRGYETYMAFLAATADGTALSFFGHGLSSQAPLGVSIELAPNQLFDHIDYFHNGWSFIILHSGVIGILLFFAQFYTLATPPKFSRNQILRGDNRLFALMLLSLASSTSSVAGIFNAGTFASLQLFMIGCFYPFSLVPVRRFPAARRILPSGLPAAQAR